MPLSPKEILLSVFRREIPERVPWVPFAGVHCASLKGYSAEEVLKDPDKLVECLLEVNRFYSPDGQPVVFDLQIEAEILGCELQWSAKSPPSVRTHVLENTKEIDLSPPQAGQGRLPMILKAMRQMKTKVGATTALFGLVCGPFTLASHLRGTNIFMDMIDDEDYVDKLLSFCVKTTLRMTELYIEAGMDVIALVDPMVSQISPAHFNRFLSRPFSDCFDHIRRRRRFSAMFVCGDATKNLDPICHTAPDSLFVDENIDIEKAKIVTDSHNVVIGGNLPLTTVMLLGTQQDNMKYAIDLMTKVGGRNFILAPGCDMPFDVPRDNVIGVTEAVRNTVMAKKMLEGYTKRDATVDVELPEYKKLIKPLVEVFTLDSDACAACGYMKAAVVEAQAYFGDRIESIEYKFTTTENISRVQKLGIKNLPSMLINGELAFSSIIPSRKELYEKISRYFKTGNP